jgi:RHS repeat-associated protein
VTTGYFYYQDSLGNTSHVTDSVGNLLERYTYSAFGTPTILSTNNTQLSTSAYGIRHLFQGQLWTQETGLNDYRNRVELPTMGVSLQPDPIGFKGDAANIYRFCNNNAVNRIDPLGLQADIEQFPKGDVLKQRIQLPFKNMPPEWPKTFIYAGHGDQTPEHLGEVKDPRYKLNILGAGPTISTANVAKAIMAHPAYRTSAQIFLFVCSAGAPKSSVARDLAVATGKPVIAPDKMLWVTPKGVYFSADPKQVGNELRADPTKMGTLQRFTPDGKSQKAQYFYGDKQAHDVDSIDQAKPVAGSSGPSAKEIDLAHQGTGVPSL